VSQIKIRLAALAETSWKEYLVRFCLGGFITVTTGLIAHRFGPSIGGLFLAFPAIFPATATLIATREKEKKQLYGMNGTSRGRLAAGIEARGTALGSIGLIVFAVIVWRLLLSGRRPELVLAAATGAWLATSITLWSVRSWVRKRRSPTRPQTTSIS
jgi:hypothetical protein